MTLADYSLTAFAVMNGGRAVAYFPQMIRVYRDPHDARAVSLSTWALFAAANVATVCYALTVAGDRVMASVFALNAIGCIAIVSLTAFKRINVARPVARFRHRIATLRQSQDLLAGALCAADSAPCSRYDGLRSERQRDDIVRYGLMS